MGVLVVLLALVLAACGGQDPSADAPVAAESPEPSTGPADEPSDSDADTDIPDVSDPEEYYSDKQIRFMVNYAPGGGGDIWMRFIAGHLVSFVPGQPNVIFEYHPGADGALGHERCINDSEPDGLTICMNSGRLPSKFVLEEAHEGLQIDWGHKLIGNGEGHVMFGNPDVFPNGYQSLKSPASSPAQLGTTTLRYGLNHAWWDLLDELDNVNITPGYSGDGEQLLAVLTGEIDAIALPNGFYLQQVAPLVESGELVALFQEGTLLPDGSTARAPGLDDIPTFQEVIEELVGHGYQGESGDFLLWSIAAAELNRYAAVHPDTPQVLVDALIQAADEMRNDPDFLEEQEELYGVGALEFHKVGPEVTDAIATIIDTGGEARLIFDRIMTEAGI